MYRLPERFVVCLSAVFLMGLSGAIQSQATFRLSDGEVLADPTRPEGLRPRTASAGATGDPALQVNSIIRSSKRRVAVINGAALQEGDVYRGVRIVRIEKKRVLVERQGRRWYKKLGGSEVKVKRRQSSTGAVRASNNAQTGSRVKGGSVKGSSVKGSSVKGSSVKKVRGKQ